MIEWAREYWNALHPIRRGAYVNFMMDEGPDRVEPIRQRALAAIKAPNVVRNPRTTCSGELEHQAARPAATTC
jgi:hypothetical protein